MIKEKAIIDGKEYVMASHGAMPFKYREAFGRDFLVDMRSLEKAYSKHLEGIKPDATEEELQEAQFGAFDLEIFARVAWLMLREAGNDVGGSPMEWLEGLDGFFEIYKVMPTVMKLWHDNNKTTSVPKKK